ncbi:hypothetical protein JZ751_027819 [Albula glossodonta]|uniref:Uncharacterized protein n=1 Tax=Albula glossodonta TaxID=121402 RepID=A0A8T2PCA8_9TELE|nr:hypothetical protein JZ751_027819 [Albula glossodonta]
MKERQVKKERKEEEGEAGVVGEWETGEKHSCAAGLTGRAIDLGNERSSPEAVWLAHCSYVRLIPPSLTLNVTVPLMRQDAAAFSTVISDHRALQRVVRPAECITGTVLPPLQDLHARRCSTRAGSIMKDPHHPNQIFSVAAGGRNHSNGVSRELSGRRWVPNSRGE